jgi:ribonuclease P protein component
VSPARLPRPARLTRPQDFDAAFQGGTRLTENKLAAVVHPNDQAHARLGLAISRKVAAQAVDRNRIKRHVRESFRARRAQLPARDIVILGRAGCARASAAELRAMLDRLWTRVAACASS